MEARNCYGRLTLGTSGSFGTEDSHPGFGGTSTNPVSLLRPEGYDEYFDPPLENKYECPICLLGLREPAQTPCGHRFCRGCILRSIRDAGPKCPVDNELLDEWQLHPDNFAKREMLNHPVFCRLKKQYECPWKGPLSKLEDHLEECDFVDVSCPKNCGKEFQRKDLEKHLEVDCPNRTIACSFSAEQVLWNGMEGLPRAQSEDHATTFVALDLSSQASKHRTPDALWVRQKLHSDLVALTQQQQVNMDELTTLVQTILGVVEQLKRKEWSVRVETLLQELISRFNHQEMRVLGFEGSVCNGSYRWRIENYRQRRQDAINGIEKAIYSPAFYIRVDGYKLCLSIYLNGVNSGVEECIDILVHVMLGVNDSELVWPLTGMLTLGILDQSEGTESPQHISHSLNTGPNQLAFQRPTGPRNVGYRCMRIPISGILEHLYIKNDSILVGIEMTY